MLCVLMETGVEFVYMYIYIFFIIVLLVRLFWLRFLFVILSGLKLLLQELLFSLGPLSLSCVGFFFFSLSLFVMLGFCICLLLCFHGICLCLDFMVWGHYLFLAI